MNDTSDNEHQSSERTETLEPIDDDQTRVDLKVDFPDITELEIYQILGKGGSGIVYKGRQLFLERDVAIKLLLINPDDEEFYKRFKREAQILAKLSHPNIVSCYQAGMTNASNNTASAPFIAMEFINGPTLQEWIKTKGQLSSFLSLDIIIYIAKALNHALQQGIIHRDVKAENILLKPLYDQDDENYQPDAFQFIPKLADLGIARTFTADRSDDLTQIGYMVGTPNFMAPEQFDDPDNIDFKADIYGLGCVFYHMLTGSKPYKGKNLTDLIISKNSDTKISPIQLVPELDHELAELVTSMLAKDKANRPTYEMLIQQCQMISDRLKQGKSHKRDSSSYVPKLILFSIFTIIIVIAVSLLFNSEVLQQTQEEPGDILLSQKNNTSLTDSKPLSENDASSEMEVPSDSGTQQEAAENVQENMHDNELIKEKMSLTLSFVDNENGVFMPGEAFNIIIQPEQDAFIYCYYKDQSNSIVRFFPNRFNDKALVSAKNTVKLPGEMPFDLNANKEGVTEYISCFAFEQDISNKVPADILGIDFEPLSFVSMQAINNTFKNSDYELLNEKTLEIKVRL